jgi:hypothetical protein
MATITSAQAGNFSNTATWIGGVVPTSVDDVIANHFITADVDFVVKSFTAQNNTGRLLLNNVTNGVRTVEFIDRFIHTSPNNSQRGMTVGTGNINDVINIIGTIINRSAFAAGQGDSAAIQITSLCTCNIIGFTENFNVWLLVISSNSIVNINMIASNIGTITTTAISLINVSTGNPTVNYTGVAITGGGNFLTYGANSGTYFLNGIFEITQGFVMSGTSVRPVYFAGKVVSYGNRNPFFIPSLRLLTTDAAEIAYNTENDLVRKSMYTAGVPLGNPSISDVRTGSTYGPSGELTGTLNVPPASAVAVGVPVDNTTGTAIINVADMGALLTSFKIS